MDDSLNLKKLISNSLMDLSQIFSFKKKQESILGIDIGSSAIKIVQLRKEKGKAILETYGVLSLGPYDKKEIGAVTNLGAQDISLALIDVMKESNVTTKSGVIAIPASSSLIFTITLPEKIDESQLEKIVPMEARKYIPVPISEVTLDWFMIPQEVENYINENNQLVGDNLPRKNKLEVLAVAIHNDVLLKYQDILEKTKLKSDSFEIEIFSSIRSTLAHELSPVLLMDFGASKTKIYIVEAGVVLVFHIVNRGSQDITKNISQSLRLSFEDAEKIKRLTGLDTVSNSEVASIAYLSVDYIFSDTNSVVFAYEKKYNKNVSKIILIGGGSLLKGLLDYTKKNFRTEVVYGNPFSKTEAPAFIEPVLEVIGPEFSVAVGLALRQLS